MRTIMETLPTPDEKAELVTNVTDLFIGYIVEEFGEKTYVGQLTRDRIIDRMLDFRNQVNAQD